MSGPRSSSLYNSIPQPAGTPYTPYDPPLGFMGTLENASIGMGRGMTNRLRGLLEAAQHPGNALRGLLDVATASPQDLGPQVRNALAQNFQQATSGPLGLGQSLGESTTMRGLLGVNALTKPGNILNMADDYKGLHRPPMRQSGAPLHDLTGGGTVYPDDVYSVNARRYYGDTSPADAETFSIVSRFKGNPDAEVTIYRAVPKNATVEEIARGDWVTVSKRYAKQHGEGPLQGDYKIISKKVKAKDIFTNGDSIHEWGYDPE